MKKKSVKLSKLISMWIATIDFTWNAFNVPLSGPEVGTWFDIIDGEYASA